MFFGTHKHKVQTERQKKLKKKNEQRFKPRRNNTQTHTNKLTYKRINMHTNQTGTASQYSDCEIGTQELEFSDVTWSNKLLNYSSFEQNDIFCVNFSQVIQTCIHDLNTQECLFVIVGNVTWNDNVNVSLSKSMVYNNRSILFTNLAHFKNLSDNKYITAYYNISNRLTNQSLENKGTILKDGENSEHIMIDLYFNNMQDFNNNSNNSITAYNIFFYGIQFFNYNRKITTSAWIKMRNLNQITMNNVHFHGVTPKIYDINNLLIENSLFESNYHSFL